jgi:EAL domain-containing protein (putative c-di-GMP-specific phosphodiesterase class I)
MLAIDRLELENELRAGLERGEFQLQYQPIRSLVSDRITGFEALLRWNSPLRGLVPPSKFVQVAEETGLIVPIGEWVLRTACRQLRQWQDEFPLEPPLTMNVNISGIQFAQPVLLQQVSAALEESGLDPNTLRLEITETVFMETAESARLGLEDLRRMGVQLHIDDFGTGYSSLAYLQRFPVSTIKIDRSFVERIGKHNGTGGNGTGSEIIKTIVALARDLGMDAVAEGGDQEQLDPAQGIRLPTARATSPAR